jgi:hypothetical protein
MHQGERRPSTYRVHKLETDQMTSSTWNRRVVLALASAAVIALFFVLREHWGHALGLLPYLLLLVCPLMHLFHHGGHGQGHRISETKQGAESP